MGPHHASSSSRPDPGPSRPLTAQYPLGTYGPIGYRVPCSYVTDMKPNYVTIYISIHNFENICNGFVTAVGAVTDLSAQDIALSGWGNKIETISRPCGGYVTATALAYHI